MVDNWLVSTLDFPAQAGATTTISRYSPIAKAATDDT
jgi:hypothetical protein